MANISTFDGYAEEYEQALNQGLSLVGEDKSYFAKRRIEWLADCLQQCGHSVTKVLDYGCGTGTATRLFCELFDIESVTGIDVSNKSLERARLENADLPTSFFNPEDFVPPAEMDLAFCNGVFHHIPVAERVSCLRYVSDCLRPGGFFAMWENNPWNPGTRWIMNRIPFDRDAILVSPIEARRLLAIAGFEVISTHFLFIFPRILRRFRWLESYCARLPIGGQYQVLCRKPTNGSNGCKRSSANS